MFTSTLNPLDSKWWCLIQNKFDARQAISAIWRRVGILSRLLVIRDPVSGCGHKVNGLKRKRERFLNS